MWPVLKGEIDDSWTTYTLIRTQIINTNETIKDKTQIFRVMIRYYMCIIARQPDGNILILGLDNDVPLLLLTLAHINILHKYKLEEIKFEEEKNRSSVATSELLARDEDLHWGIDERRWESVRTRHRKADLMYGATCVLVDQPREIRIKGNPNNLDFIQ